MKTFLPLLALFLSCFTSFGAGFKISDLSQTNTVGGTEWIELDQGGIKSWKISSRDLWNALGTNQAITLISITTNINNYSFVTNQYVYQTNVVNVQITTNLTVYQTNIVNQTITTNLTVYQTNISNFQITTNQITYQTNIANYFITTNQITYETNIVNYLITTNLITYETNISNISYVTNLNVVNEYVSNIFVTNIVVYNGLWQTNRTKTIATNTTSLTLDFLGEKDWYDCPTLMETNVTLSPTNLMAGRELWVFFSAANGNYDVSITNAAAVDVRWNLNCPTNGSTSFTVTNGGRAELCLTVRTNNILHAVYGQYR